MHRSALVTAIAEEAGLTHRDADAALNAATEAISRAVAAGETVTIPGFGTFEQRSRAARTGRNPRTGEPMEIAAGRSPAFKPAAAFKRLLTDS